MIWEEILSFHKGVILSDTDTGAVVRCKATNFIGEYTVNAMIPNCMQKLVTSKKNIYLGLRRSNNVCYIIDIFVSFSSENKANNHNQHNCNYCLWDRCWFASFNVFEISEKVDFIREAKQPNNRRDSRVL